MIVQRGVRVKGHDGNRCCSIYSRDGETWFLDIHYTQPVNPEDISCA